MHESHDAGSEVDIVLISSVMRLSRRSISCPPPAAFSDASALCRDGDVYGNYCEYEGVCTGAVSLAAPSLLPSVMPPPAQGWGCA